MTLIKNFIRADMEITLLCKFGRFL